MTTNNPVAEQSSADERTLFEQWHAAQFPYVTMHYTRNEDGSYVDQLTEDDWQRYHRGVISRARYLASIPQAHATGMVSIPYDKLSELVAMYEHCFDDDAVVARPVWLANALHLGDRSNAPALQAQSSAPANPNAEEDAYVIDRLSKLLAGVCIALKGEEEELHRHSYHDIVEVAEKIKLELDLYRAVATPADMPASDAANKGYKLTKSIIHKCPALVLPQSYIQKLGNTAQIIPLKGLTDEAAQMLLADLNAAAPKECASDPLLRAMIDDGIVAQSTPAAEPAFYRIVTVHGKKYLDNLDDVADDFKQLWTPYYAAPQQPVAAIDKDIGLELASLDMLEAFYKAFKSPFAKDDAMRAIEHLRKFVLASKPSAPTTVMQDEVGK